MKYICLLFLFLFLFLGFVYSGTIVNTTKEDFDLGEYDNTISTSDGNVLLDSSSNVYYNTGEYLSQIFNLNESSNLVNLIFSTPVFYKQDLPNDGDVVKDINMNGNVFLMHVDDDALIKNESELYGLGLRGDITSTTGKFGDALIFDGSNDIAFTDYLIPTNEYTFSLWVKTTTNNRTIFSFANDTPTGSTYDRRLGIDGSNKLVYYIYPNSSVSLIGAATTITNNNWHHIVIISKLNSSTSKYDLNVYLDGVLDSNKTEVNFGGYNSYTNPRLNIGYQATYFLGAIDDFAYYNRALTIDEISYLYNSGTGNEFLTDNSLVVGWHFNETINSMTLQDTSPTPKTFVYPSAANNYTGISYEVINNSLFSQNVTNSTDYFIKTSQFYPPAGAMSISFWFKSILDRKSFLGWVGGSPNNSVFIEGGYIKWYYSNASTYFATTKTVNDGKWHHVVFTRNSSNSRKVYLDGVLNNSSTTSFTINNDFTTAVILYLFHSAVYYGGSGSLDELAIWDREISSDEALNIYKRGISDLKVQIRACDDSSCSSDEDFEGPSGENSYFNLSDNNYDLSSFTNLQYLQYKVFFETLDLDALKNISPQFLDVNINYVSNVPQNEKPEILDMNICKENCKKTQMIVPGIDSFVLQIEINDPNGNSDINWESATLQIYTASDNNEDSDDWDHITLNEFTSSETEGCEIISDINCILINANDLSTKFLKGGADIYFKISDYSGESVTYELNYFKDENNLDINGLNIQNTTSISIDVSQGYFSGDPGEENIPIITDKETNYIVVVNNSNSDVNLFFLINDFIGISDFPITGFEWNNSNLAVGNNFENERNILIENWNRGAYPDSNSQNIYLWLDMPPVSSGEYTGSFSFEIEN